MSSTLNDPSAIAEQAAEWLLRFEACEISSAEHARYLAWLSASGAHRAETLKMLLLWDILRQPRPCELEAAPDEFFANPARPH